MSGQEHWEDVYTSKRPDQVSWYAPHLGSSLAYVRSAGLSRQSAILDVGGGASTLVDDLLDEGFAAVTVLDLSATAIERARERLAARAGHVRWLVGDILDARLGEQSVDFWHDRAVFHFLRSDDQRLRYVAQVRHAVRPGGHVLMATFGPDGPERCSGLDVVRYDADELHAQFGAPFVKLGSSVEQHTTPSGSIQEFMYCYCRVA